MAGGLAGIHEPLGGLVVDALIVAAVLAGIATAGGSDRWTRTASFIAAGLLAAQYVLGGLSIAKGSRNSNTHYVVGLVVPIPVALQHSSAGRRSSQTRGVALSILPRAATLPSVIASVSGMWGAAGITP